VHCHLYSVHVAPFQIMCLGINYHRKTRNLSLVAPYAPHFAVLRRFSGQVEAKGQPGLLLEDEVVEWLRVVVEGGQDRDQSDGSTPGSAATSADGNGDDNRDGNGNNDDGDADDDDDDADTRRPKDKTKRYSPGVMSIVTPIAICMRRCSTLVAGAIPPWLVVPAGFRSVLAVVAQRVVEVVTLAGEVAFDAVRDDTTVGAIVALLLLALGVVMRRRAVARRALRLG
jgi:hypothetical protein